MTFTLARFVLYSKNVIKYTECKRYAGHSKWANIRHTKMAKDAEKATALRTTITKMKVAISEGKSAKPEENLKLARVIETAKENSLPMASIKNFLTKMQTSKVPTQTALLESRGPSGCVVLIQILTDNVVHTRNCINTHLRKSKFKTSETPSQGIYTKKGIILVDIKNPDMDKLMDDAIEVGAEEVEKLQEDDQEFVQFSCGEAELWTTRKKLEDLKYKIIRADVEYIPNICVSLSDEDMECVSKLYDRLNSMEEVVGIFSNIT